jgi:REP element-mobilizing transposase RayT
VWHSRPRLWGFAFDFVAQPPSALNFVNMKPRKYKYRRNLPHIQKDGRAIFVTFNTISGQILPPIARDLAMQHCLHDNASKMRLHAAVVMPDHVHIIFTPLRSENTEPFTLEEIVGSIKGASSHTINKALRRKGHLWQDESFDHVARCEESLEQKIQYIRDNPVKAGLVARPEDYKWLWVEQMPEVGEIRVKQQPPAEQE